PAELDPADENYAQKLLREMRIEYKDSKKLYDGIEKPDMSVPTRGTTFWGSCYVTESTQKWGTDASSGYTTSNTPFFAVVAYFDTESLPWGDNTITAARAKIDNKQKDLNDQLKAWRDERDAKQAELDALPEAGGGGMSEAEADAIFQAYVQWWKDHLSNPNSGRRYFNNISKQRDKFIKTKELDEAGYLDKIKRDRSTLRDQDLKGGLKLANKSYRNREYPENKRVGSPTELDATDLDVEQKEFKKTLEADRKLRAGDPNAEKRQQLNDEIKALNKKIEDFKNEFNSSGDKYPKLENTTTNKEFYTQFIYEQGINRIFYSQADNKFYLNYHEIPFAKRGGQRHTLTENDPWLDELKSKLPNGKDFPTKDKGAPATAAVLPPSAELMSKLSQLLNGEIPETDLSPAERRSMDFYLYGRVAPGLVQYFGGAKRIDRIDLQSGYVAWYTANKKDNVVSYPCYVRNKKVDTDGKETKSSISNVRLMMVYYAWLNPNTKESDTTYASPVLRNNIYHMHITGFTKMGLSAIPFVPRVTEGNGYKFLHWKLDPDEEVPTANAPLNATSGSGSPTSLLTPRSSSFSLTF
ncbi:fimbria major subunit, partial [uncultured Porphyromonas sp.]|uniref:fimbria major subunit n=1 Tax=uncultured Porphyromonas sp. TaxID=159274 RepID=UPI00338FC775